MTVVKLEQLRETLRGVGGAVVAFSGGVDSTFLLRVAHEERGDRAVALLGISPSLASREQEDARRLAGQIGARLMTVETCEMERPAYTANPPDRCYHCKHELFESACRLAEELELPVVLDGANADDAGDHRPGMHAARDLGVRSPLLEVGLTKDEIRSHSRDLGLETWAKPALACLASRIPYGTEITAPRLAAIERCEAVLADLGFSEARARLHEPLVRIEVPPEELPRMLEPSLRQTLIERLTCDEILYVTVDLEGFRSGSMNRPLE